CEGWYRYAGGLSFDDFTDAMAAIREVGPGRHFLGTQQNVDPFDKEVPAAHFLGTQHTLDHFEKAFFAHKLMDFSSFEQWSTEGENDMDARGRAKAKALLASYEAPALERETEEALADFVKRREGELPDNVR